MSGIAEGCPLRDLYQYKNLFLWSLWNFPENSSIFVGTGFPSRLLLGPCVLLGLSLFHHTQTSLLSIFCSGSTWVLSKDGVPISGLPQAACCIRINPFDKFILFYHLQCRFCILYTVHSVQMSLWVVYLLRCDISIASLLLNSCRQMHLCFISCADVKTENLIRLGARNFTKIPFQELDKCKVVRYLTENVLC